MNTEQILVKVKNLRKLAKDQETKKAELEGQRTQIVKNLKNVLQIDDESGIIEVAEERVKELEQLSEKAEAKIATLVKEIDETI